MKEIVKQLETRINPKKLKIITHKNIVAKMLHYETNQVTNKFKFGVLYAREGQTCEDEMFANEHGSKEFNEFLKILGDRVEMKGFEGFCGGLDSRSNTTGRESIHTKWREKEIMFHVSTLLPYTPKNTSQLERKRHLGNDIVVIVFKEGNTPYDPNTITSNYNHVILVVQPIDIKGKTYYRFACGSKVSVQRFTPYLPYTPILPKDRIKDYLLCKAINGERAAYKSSPFSHTITRTRQELIQVMVDLSTVENV